MSFIATTTISDPRSSETITCLETLFLLKHIHEHVNRTTTDWSENFYCKCDQEVIAVWPKNKDTSNQTSKQTETERAECDQEAGGICEDLRQHSAVVFDQTESIWWIESKFNFSLDFFFETQTHQTNLLDGSVSWCVLCSSFPSQYYAIGIQLLCSASTKT